MLEFYASTEGEVVLANVSGAETRVAGSPAARQRAGADSPRYDPMAGSLDGGARRVRGRVRAPARSGCCSAGRPSDADAAAAPSAGCSSRGRLGAAPSDLFCRDADGDYWMVGREAELIRTADGVVPPGPIRDALGDLPCIDTVAVYGVPAGDGEIVVAAVSLRDPGGLKPLDLSEALLRGWSRGCAPRSSGGSTRSIPHRGRAAAHGAPEGRGRPPAGDGRTYYRTRSGAYRPLTAAARRRLLAPPAGRRAR